METQSALQILEGLLNQTKHDTLEWRKGARLGSYIVTLLSGYAELRIDAVPSTQVQHLTPGVSKTGSTTNNRKLVLRERDSEKIVLSVDQFQDKQVFSPLIYSLFAEVEQNLARQSTKALEPFLRELSA